jgi:glyoxylase-like metal-dependent hydrolase (beta-lactamase superfamily II)
MQRWIQAISTGHCDVRDYITFEDEWTETTRRFELWIWLILGGNRPVLVDTGPNDVAGFNRATSKYIPGGIRQLPEERTVEALQQHGVRPDDVSHVIVTHLHGDHYDAFVRFPRARLVVNRREFTGALEGIAPAVMQSLAARWPESLQLVDDDAMILPGIRTFVLGCHSEGSQAVAVTTSEGTAVITGDVVYLYDNIEQDRPINSGNPDACRAAMARIREEADIVLPAHDPLVAERHPGGMVGRPPRRGHN